MIAAVQRTVATISFITGPPRRTKTESSYSRTDPGKPAPGLDLGALIAGDAQTEQSHKQWLEAPARTPPTDQATSADLLVRQCDRALGLILSFFAADIIVEFRDRWHRYSMAPRQAGIHHAAAPGDDHIDLVGAQRAACGSWPRGYLKEVIQKAIVERIRRWTTSSIWMPKGNERPQELEEKFAAFRQKIERSKIASEPITEAIAKLIDADFSLSEIKALLRRAAHEIDNLIP